jgi:hypothetical protein
MGESASSRVLRELAEVRWRAGSHQGSGRCERMILVRLWGTLTIPIPPVCKEVRSKRSRPLGRRVALVEERMDSPFRLFGLRSRYVSLE